jgi:branched-chain amino acid transport system ATP-binding protein
MRQMLATSIALMRRPKLMMFDEPTANLAPNLAEEVLDRLIGLEEKFGITIIFVEQNATMVLEACDTAYLLVNGRVNYAGDARELLDNPRFGQIFLGIETV